MQRHVWHYLYNSSTGRTPIDRITTERVRVTLPNVIRGREEDSFLTVHDRDQRTLVAFDGLMLAGSPHRKGACIEKVPIGRVEIPKGWFFTPKDDEIGVAPYGKRVLEEGKEFIFLDISRYFLLLRAGNFVFAGYDSKNLAPRYLFARVHKGGKYGEWVEWLVGG